MPKVDLPNLPIELRNSLATAAQDSNTSSIIVYGYAATIADGEYICPIARVSTMSSTYLPLMVATQPSIVKGMTVSLLTQPGTAASFDVSVPSGNSFTIKARKAGVAGNDIQFTLKGDSSAGAGVVIEDVGDLLVNIHYESGVSVGTDVADALKSKSRLCSAGAAGNAGPMISPGDDITITNLQNGDDFGINIVTLVKLDLDKIGTTNGLNYSISDTDLIINLTASDVLKQQSSSILLDPGDSIGVRIDNTTHANNIMVAIEIAPMI